MNDEKNKPIDEQISELETSMSAPDFWTDKARAQAVLRELQDLKAKKEGLGKYDKGGAIITIFSGAGGDDAEDFTAMLYRMYFKYAESRGWGVSVIDETPNTQGGYRNISFEVSGPKNDSNSKIYKTLKNESGVHRLVRLSPFNAKSLRQTSFSLVEVIPKFDRDLASEIDVPEKDLEITSAKAGGPGGQNVNKRETAVRIVHIPSKLSVHVSSERSQAQNKEKALEIIKAKIYKMQEDERVAREKGLYVSKTTSIDWGNQIRSYVLHPYKMVKDHRTDVETSQAEKVLEGDIQEFLDAENQIIS